MGKNLIIPGADFSTYGIPTQKVAYLTIDGNAYYLRLSPTVTISGATITFSDTDYAKVTPEGIYDEKYAKWGSDDTSISLGKSTNETLNADADLLTAKLYRGNDNLTSLKGLFANCKNFSADLTEFNGAGITNLSAMFWFAKMDSIPEGLESADFSDATNFAYMFFFSEIEGEIDLSGWGCSISGFDSMFQNSKFSKINLSGWNWGSAWVNYIFTNCSNLTEIVLDNCTLNASRLQYASQLFAGCSALTKIGVKSIGTTVRQNLIGNLAAAGYVFYESGDSLLKDDSYGSWALDSSSTTLDSSYSQYSGNPSDYSTSGTYKVYILFNGKYYMFSKTIG